MTTQLYNIKPFDYYSFAYGYKFHSLESIVAEINDSKDCTVHTPEFMSASYAFTAQEEAGYPQEEEAWDAYLEDLSDAGAEFDRSEAILHCWLFLRQQHQEVVDRCNEALCASNAEIITPDELP